MGKKVVTVRANGRRRVQTEIEGKTLTQQQFKDQTDVNNIMEKYRKTGSITHINNSATGVYLDLTTMPDYEQSLNTVIRGQNAFAAMPADIRQRFGNDPAQLIRFLADPSKQEEAIQLGLRIRPPQSQQPVTPPPAPGTPESHVPGQTGQPRQG